MSAPPSLSDSLLHAFVDGELSGADRLRVLAAMDADAQVSERVCALRESKEWVRLAFDQVQAPERPVASSRRRGAVMRPLPALVASVVLMLGGFLLGWFAQETQRPQTAISHFAVPGPEAGEHRVLLHVDRSDPAGFQAVLDDAERLLNTHRGRGVQVDVLANAGGIELLRADGSPQAARIARMSQQYDALRFIACANTLDRLHEQGAAFVLVDRVDTSTTAVDHVVSRLQRGWTYLRV